MCFPIDRFPAFSWCSGLQRVTAGCASLGRGHHSLQGSSKNSSQQKLTGNTKSQRSVQSNEFTNLGTRPTPPPKPGPLIVEVFLTRGTKSGLGFSITGGVGNETINGDSGIFVTKVCNNIIYFYSTLEYFRFNIEYCFTT